MDIPDYVKRKAMDAVSHKETTDMMRAYQHNGIEASPASLFTYSPEPPPNIHPIPEYVKKLAMDALSHPETRSMIKLMEDTGEVRTPITLTRQSQQIGMKIAQMHRQGRGVDSIQSAITKDNYGWDYG